MFKLINLPYDYKALEPFIDEETMHFHHDKHHATYVKNLNDLLSGHSELLSMDITKLLQSFDKVPEDIRTKVGNNAGGVANHNMFWEVMCPPSESNFPKDSLLSNAVGESFGSFDTFKEKFTVAALGVFGSGWAWLIKNGKRIEIITTSNQDSPFSDLKSPILCLDVWEHAYYLKYKNMRADYINAWWNVVNWKEVEKLFKEGGDK